MEYKPLGLFGAKPAPAPTIKEAAPHHTQEENKFRAILETPIVSNVWEVVCVVSRHKGDDEKKARAAFADYVAKSDMGYGRVGHEQVTLLHDGMVVESHVWAGPKGK